MKRTLLNALLEWKNKSKRKPVLIDGARQTGKTFLLNILLGQHFAHVMRIDFLENPGMKSAFLGALTPEHVLKNLQSLTQQHFNPETDLLILDEIGECQQAITSLKYFAEQTPHYFVAASGSNIGLLNSFPVGKVEAHTLLPMTFEEFLMASQQNALYELYKTGNDHAAAEHMLMQALSDYYFVGGMPEAVHNWFENPKQNILERCAQVRDVQHNLILGYTQDFGKYSGKLNANLIDAVFKNIPQQLSRYVDDSVKRYRFADIVPKKNRYSDFANAIDWLEKCHLLLKNHQIDGEPKTPLMAYKTEHKVKLYAFDIGLLNAMLHIDYSTLLQQQFQFKGYLAENFVQQELAAQDLTPSFSWASGNSAEIEFILAGPCGQIVPVEVKSGKRTKAKSLQTYIQQHKPQLSIKLIGGQGDGQLNTWLQQKVKLSHEPQQTTRLVMPIYFTGHLSAILHLLH